MKDKKGAKMGSAIIAENHILLQEKHSDFWTVITSQFKTF